MLTLTTEKVKTKNSAYAFATLLLDGDLQQQARWRRRAVKRNTI